MQKTQMGAESNKQFENLSQKCKLSLLKEQQQIKTGRDGTDTRLQREK